MPIPQLTALNMRTVRHAGVLGGDRIAAIAFDGAVLGLESVYHVWALRLRWIDHDVAHTQLIFLDHVNVANRARRAYFLCPLTSARCSELVLMGDRFVSRVGGRARRSAANRQSDKLVRAEDRLLGLDGARPARGPNRARLIARVQQDPFLEKRSIGLAEIVSQVASSDLLKKQRAQRSKAGFSRQFAVLPPGEEQRKRHPVMALYFGDGLGHADANGPAWQTPASRAVLEDHPVLLAASLSWYLENWPRIAIAVAEPVDLHEGERVEVTIDCAEPESAILKVAGSRESDFVTKQKLRLSRGADGKRWFFLCPAMATRHDKLFLRDGLFASAKAHRLANRSQF